MKHSVWILLGLTGTVFGAMALADRSQDARGNLVFSALPGGSELPGGAVMGYRRQRGTYAMPGSNAPFGDIGPAYPTNGSELPGGNAWGGRKEPASLLG